MINVIGVIYEYVSLPAKEKELYIESINDDFARLRQIENMDWVTIKIFWFATYFTSLFVWLPIKIVTLFIK
jgi:hypothetical protein